jgi:dTDP-4-amino-4,6-dideoxygalactose transaminase
MYPAPLECVKALQPHRVEKTEMPGARQFADRLLTLPTEKALAGERLEFALDTLRKSS